LRRRLLRLCVGRPLGTRSRGNRWSRHLPPQLDRAAGADLDLAQVFRPSIRAIFGEASPAEALGLYADLDEYALLHQAALWARGEEISPEPAPGDGTVTAEVGRAWGAILLRRPRWRAEAESRINYEAIDRTSAQAEAVAELGPAVPGSVEIDLAEIDARPAEATATDSLLAIVGRDGEPAAPLSRSLGRLPAYSLVARRFRRII